MDYDMAKSNAQSLADRWNEAVYIAKSCLTGDYCLLSDNKKPSITFRVIEIVTPHTHKDRKRGQINITTYRVKQYNATSKTVVCVNDKPVCMAVGGKTVSNIIAYLNGYNVDIADGKIKKALDRCRAEVEDKNG